MSKALKLAQPAEGRPPGDSGGMGPAAAAPPAPPRPRRAVAFVWGLVDGRVTRGDVLDTAASMLLSGGTGWDPLAASAAAGGGSGAARAVAGCASGDESDSALDDMVLGYAAGWDHALRVTNNCAALCRGWNAHGAADPAAPGPRVVGWRPVAGLAGLDVVQVAAGRQQGVMGSAQVGGGRCVGSLVRLRRVATAPAMNSPQATTTASRSPGTVACLRGASSAAAVAGIATGTAAPAARQRASS
jgi:hypothetical protein